MAANVDPSDVVLGIHVPLSVYWTLDLEAAIKPSRLAQAAQLALDITATVETMKRNRASFESLADDSRYLAYVIVCVHRHATDVLARGELEEHLLNRALPVLIEVKGFAEKVSSMTKSSAHTEVDAGWVQYYRQDLKQCLAIFRTDIGPKDTVHKLIELHLTAVQGNFLEMLEDKVKPGGQLKGSSPGPGAKPVLGLDLTNDYSVKERENINFAWASGTDFRSNYASVTRLL